MSLISKLCGIKSIFKNSSSFSEEDKEIKYVYDNDLNIIEVHEQVLKKLERERMKMLPEIEREIKALENSNCESIVEKKFIEEQINNLRKKQHFIENSLNEYKKLSEPLLENYKKLKQVREHPQRNRAILHVISDYVDVVRLFIPCNIYRKKQNKICTFCGNELEFTVLDGIRYCSNCFSEICPEMISFNINKENIIHRFNNYEDRENFWKTIVRFQGKQNIKLPESLFRDLDNYFRSYGLPTGDEIKKMPLSEDGRKANTNKELMFRALFHTGYSAFYEDINLICHEYWGWSLPDISHLEDIIMQDYDSFQNIYQQVKTSRKSCLSTQFLLYKFLKRHGFPCKVDDFKLARTNDILEFHENVYDHVCQILGWKNERLI